MISDVLDVINRPAFTAFGAPTSWAEVAGFITGAFCVWLVARGHILNWPVGIANAAFFLVLFATAGLYADAGLQVVYMALGAYGWWAWLRGGENRTELAVSRVTGTQWILLALAGGVALAAVWRFLDVATDSNVAGWDAITTVLSLLATWAQCRRKVESWLLWIAADVIYIPLYVSKGLAATGILYGVFLALCVMGLIEWRKQFAAGQTEPEVQSVALRPAA